MDNSRNRLRIATVLRRKLFFACILCSVLVARNFSLLMNNSQLLWQQADERLPTIRGLPHRANTWNREVQINDERMTHVTTVDSHHSSGRLVGASQHASDQSSSGGQDDDSTCEIISEPWQTKHYPSCNLIHELVTSISELQYIIQGNQHQVFQVNIHHETVVLKVLHYRMQNFTQSNIRSGQRNAIVHERLASSPYIFSNLGFCGTSLVVPYSEPGTLLDLILAIKQDEREMPPPMDLLRIAVQLAEALAALHEIGFAHKDFDNSQFLYNDGVFQLNDFHSGRFITNETTACQDYQMHPFTRSKHLRLDQDDVFRLCSELYALFPTCGLRDGDTPRRSICYQSVTEGMEVVKSTSMAEEAVVKAMRLCWKKESDLMASAREVASFLRGELNRLLENYTDTEKPDNTGVVKVTGLYSEEEEEA
jgi:hypothetical protein